MIFFKKKKEKKEQKRMVAVKKAIIIKAELKEIEDVREKLNDKSFNEGYNDSKKDNYECPICSSTNIINRIGRLKGEIHGSSESRSSHSLFFGSHSSSSEIDGEIDTLPINRCSDCGHEWYVEEYTHWGHISENGVIDYINYSLAGVTELNGCTYDETDPTEEYNSLEEKQQAFNDSINTLSDEMKCFWVGKHIETFHAYRERYMIERSIYYERYYNDKVFKQIGLVDFSEDELGIETTK